MDILQCKLQWMKYILKAVKFIYVVYKCAEKYLSAFFSYLHTEKRLNYLLKNFLIWRILYNSPLAEVMFQGFHGFRNMDGNNDFSITLSHLLQGKSWKNLLEPSCQIQRSPWLDENNLFYHMEIETVFGMKDIQTIYQSL